MPDGEMGEKTDGGYERSPQMEEGQNVRCLEAPEPEPPRKIEGGRQRHHQSGDKDKDKFHQEKPGKAGEGGSLATRQSPRHMPSDPGVEEISKDVQRACSARFVAQQTEKDLIDPIASGSEVQIGDESDPRARARFARDASGRALRVSVSQ